MLREDGVVTDVPSGENAGKSLGRAVPGASRRSTSFIELDGKSPATERFRFAIEPTWNRQNLRLAVFVQDKRTGVIHQATDLPWRSTPTAATRASGSLNASAATANRQGALNVIPHPLDDARCVVSALRRAKTSGRKARGSLRPEEQPGLKVGEKAPSFTLKDQEGKERSLDDFLKKGKVALVFYRSADW